MSQHELERFIADLGRDSQLLTELRSQADDLAAVQRWAQARGYQFSPAEAEALVRRCELADDELDMVAGGWTDPPPPPTGGGG